jgi:hypothetical protein
MIEFKTYKDLMAHLKDKVACRQYIENMRWEVNHFALTATELSHTN